MYFLKMIFKQIFFVRSLQVTRTRIHKNLFVSLLLFTITTSLFRWVQHTISSIGGQHIRYSIKAMSLETFFSGLWTLIRIEKKN